MRLRRQEEGHRCPRQGAQRETHQRPGQAQEGLRRVREAARVARNVERHRQATEGANSRGEDHEAAEEEAKSKAQAEREELEKEAKKATSRRKTRSRNTTSDTQKAIIKVLTSATVIRGVLGILGKMIK